MRRLLKAGVSGYLLKKSAGPSCRTPSGRCTRAAWCSTPRWRGPRWRTPGRRRRAAPTPTRRLTDREKQVLKLVAEGLANKEVADVLGISVKTAMSHREKVMEKLGLHNRTELVRFALRRGVIRVDP